MPALNNIQHVVLIIKENHSFDNYFGRFPGVDGDSNLPDCPDPINCDPSHTNTTFNAKTPTFDPWVALQYGEANIPQYYSYARQFTLCDKFFSEVAGPSLPNHLMLIAAASPLIDNPPYRPRISQAHAATDEDENGPTDPSTTAPFDLITDTLPDRLVSRGLSWGNYGGYSFAFIPGLAMTKITPTTRNYLPPVDVTEDWMGATTQFINDASKGDLPSVSWVYAPHTLSEHPFTGTGDKYPKGDPRNVDYKVCNIRTAPSATNQGTTLREGAAWTDSLVQAIVKGGLWDKTAIFITWDDWGGWSDHAAIPNKEQWMNGTQFRYGPRVPCLVLGKYAKLGYVSHTEYSHVSLLRFCEEVFGISPLNMRDGSANDMLDCFDFNQPGLQPPAPMPGI